ncbi:Amidase 1 [Trifolium repens]|nr:Amidase 1 [Trifolium repens]
MARGSRSATSTGPTILALLNASATCVGKTIMDEMAYSINGENIHYIWHTLKSYWCKACGFLFRNGYRRRKCTFIPYSLN